MNALPFGDFLELLRAKGLGVGLHEHLAVGKLLSRWESTSRDELRNAIAALVARDEDEVLEIRALFDEFYPAEPTVGGRLPEGGKTEGPVVREFRLIQYLQDRRAWAAAIGIAALAFGIALWVRSLSNLNLPQPPVPPLLAAAGPAPPAPPPAANAPESDPRPSPPFIWRPPAPAAQIDPPPQQLNWPLLGAMAAAALTVCLIALWGLRIRSRAAQWTFDAWQRALASLPGPYHARLVLKDLVTRVPRHDLEDAATLLARSFADASRGRQLDVQKSLRETLRAGMRPQLVYKARRVQQTILVLQDISQLMDPHQARVEHLLTDLRRLGIVLERWYFNGDISIASHRPDGPPIPLDALAKRREDWPLLIVSSGLGMAATLTLPNRTWISALKTFTRRVWLTPIRDRQLWPAALDEVPIRAVPMTRSGLLEAAYILSQGDYASAGALSRAREKTRPVTMADVEHMRQIASVVPHPTIEELELLRQRFAPGVPESAVLHVATEVGSYAGAPIRMSDGDIRDHLRRLRRNNADLEIAIRQYLLKVLTDSEPAAGSAAHLRWQVSNAIHQIQLAELTSGHDAEAVAAVAALARGPLWNEVRAAIERLPEDGRQAIEARRVAGIEASQRRKAAPPAFRDTTGVPVQPLGWLAPRWQDAAFASVAAIVIAGTSSMSPAFRLQATHAVDAYLLEYTPPSAGAGAGGLKITVRGDRGSVPGSVQIYRDGEVAGAPYLINEAGPTIALESGTAPRLYQARASLGNGVFALSNTLWAPSVLVVIDAQPWARITLRSRDARVPPVDSQLTPAALQLPEGIYDISLENGNLTPPLTRQITVSSSGEKTFRFVMPGFSADDLLNQLEPAQQPQPAMRY